jgi:hypothetical protein
MTLSIAHKQDNRVVLDLVREWKPPFSPEAVVGECADTLKLYGVKKVTGDRYGWQKGEYSPLADISTTRLNVRF